MTRRPAFFGDLSALFWKPEANNNDSSTRRLDLLALEPRLLFSVSPIDIGVENVESADSFYFAEAEPIPGNDPLRNLEFGDYQRLFNTVDRDENSSENRPDVGSNDSSLDYRLDGLLLDSVDHSDRFGMELIFVDEDTPDYLNLADELLKSGNSRNIRLVILDNDTDGISQITDVLSEYSDVSAIHLISHGSAGQVNIGDVNLSLSNLELYSREIASWNDSLQTGADILIYGCDLASNADGQGLLDALSVLSDTDVAASEDLTGHRSLGGDWDLEFQIGDVETDLLIGVEFQTNYEHLLAIDIDQAWLNANGGGSSPYYLDHAGETYVLQTDVSTEGTAFAIIDDDITLDLNGHTITYNNSNQINIVNHSFEEGEGAAADNWDFSGAPTAERFSGEFLKSEIYDGSQSIRFESNGTEQSIDSSSTVTLEANTRYSLSSMFYHQDRKTAAELFVRLEHVTNGTVYEVNWGNANWRGIQFKEKVFTTDGGGEFSISVGIRGEANSEGDEYSFVDNLQIQKHKNYGVVIGPQNWGLNNYPGINKFGDADNATVRNGAIIQGEDGGTWSHAIFQFRGKDLVVDDLDILVHGEDTSAILSDGPNSVTISNNTITSDVKTISSRDNFYGAVINNVTGEIYGNTITNGPHAGIRTASQSEIYDNTIQLQTKYTNGFAIGAKHGSKVYGNLIDNAEGEFTSRGILISGNKFTETTEVFDNTIRVQGKANNQEYGGSALGGVYGLQLEKPKNVEVYNNDVTVIADETDAFALRINKSATDVKIYDNTFTAITVSGSSRYSAGMRITTINSIDGEDSVELENNTFVINDTLVGMTSHAKLKFAGTHIHVDSPVSDYQFEAYSTGGTTVLEFIDNSFEDAHSKEYFEEGIWKTYRRWNGDKPRKDSSHLASWTTGVTVIDSYGAVSNAAVSIKDDDGVEVFSGLTDENGEVDSLLREFQTTGGDKVVEGNYTVTVIANSIEKSVEVTAGEDAIVDLGEGDSIIDEEAPVLVNNEGLLLDEGSLAPINASELKYDDAIQPDIRVVYSVTSGLEHGQLELATDPNKAVTSFTQEDINLGRLIYRHDDSETIADSFTFDVDDSKGNVISNQTFSIAIDLVDDKAPEEVNNLGSVLDEGAVIGINRDTLRYDDSEQPAGKVTFTVTTGPENGQLELTSDPNNSIASFTQEDIDSGRLVFRHDHSDTTSDTFTFDVDDGEGNVISDQTFDITVNPIDDTPPELVNNQGLTLDEGDLVAIERISLRFVDSEQVAGQVKFSVTAIPGNGQLELSTDPNSPITSFTQQDINLGLLFYRHDGSDTTSDLFVFDVDDGQGNVVRDQDFDITVNPVDDAPPEMIKNTGLTLDEGEVAGIDKYMLRFVDSEQLGARVTYTITSGLDNGQLELTTDPNKAVTSFTQKDINQNLLVYRHNDSETIADSFTFDVDDGQGNSSDDHTFLIDINPVDDLAPEQVNNTGISLSEGSLTGIDRGSLRFDDSEQVATNVTFTVTGGLDNGQLELTTDPNKSIVSFTQDDIDLGRVVYRHDHSDTTSDSFSFNVDDGQGNVNSGQTFEITIDPIDDMPPEMVNNEGVSGERGETVAIERFDLRYLDSEQVAGQVRFTITGGLDNGQLERTTDPNNPITTFTQKDVNQGRLVYRHNGSRTSSDSFAFDVDDGQGNVTSGQSFGITINFNDDEPPVLENNQGLELNEGAMAGIGNSRLSYVDAGQPASRVTYTLTDAPGNGQLELTTNPNNAITSFTQEDIDLGRLVYRHDDSETLSDSFEFDVDDGEGNVTSDQSFEITVNPVDDTPPEEVNNHGVMMGKGTTTKIERYDLRFVDSEMPSGRVRFTVTDGLENGQLELTTDPNEAITSFTQQQVNNGLLVYRHEGNDTSPDTFTFDVGDSKGNFVVEQTFEILFDDAAPTEINNKSITLDQGEDAAIERFDLRFVDANRPAGQVTYTVLDGLTSGHLALLSNPNEAITSFTQKQINNGLLVYRHDNSESDSDSFEFVVDDGLGNTTERHLFQLFVI